MNDPYGLKALDRAMPTLLRSIHFVQNLVAYLVGGILCMKALLQYHDVDPERNTSIICYCDNVAALQRVREPPITRGIRYRLLPEYDLINEIHLALDEVALRLDPNHVKGHQDDDKDYNDMSHQARVNVDCDKLAGNLLDDYEGYFEPRDSAPFIPSSQAALLIDGCIVTTDLVKQVRMATNGEDLRQYITWGNNWTDDIFDSVDWPSLGSALQKESIANRVRLVKFIHGWLGTRKNLKRWRQSTTRKCPICERRTETQRHILRCKHVNSVANFCLQLIQAKRYLSQCQVMPRLWELFSQNLTHALGYGPEPTATINLNDSYGPKLAAAISEQSIIGWHNAIKGFITPSWGEIQNDYYCERYPDSGSRPKYYCASVFQVKLIQAMWRIFQGIWKQRNAILHDEVQGSNVKIMDKRIKRIYDYKYQYVHDSDLELFRLYDLPTALQLPPFECHMRGLVP